MRSFFKEPGVQIILAGVLLALTVAFAFGFWVSFKRSNEMWTVHADGQSFESLRQVTLTHNYVEYATPDGKRIIFHGSFTAVEQ
jgi:hypothetical protein